MICCSIICAMVVCDKMCLILIGHMCQVYVFCNVGSSFDWRMCLLCDISVQCARLCFPCMDAHAQIIVYLFMHTHTQLTYTYTHLRICMSSKRQLQWLRIYSCTHIHTTHIYIYVLAYMYVRSKRRLPAERRLHSYGCENIIHTYIHTYRWYTYMHTNRSFIRTDRHTVHTLVHIYICVRVPDQKGSSILQEGCRATAVWVSLSEQARLQFGAIAQVCVCVCVRYT